MLHVSIINANTCALILRLITHWLLACFAALRSSRIQRTAWCRWWSGTCLPFTLVGKDLWPRSPTTPFWARCFSVTGTCPSKQRILLLLWARLMFAKPMFALSPVTEFICLRSLCYNLSFSVIIFSLSNTVST